MTDSVRRVTIAMLCVVALTSPWWSGAAVAQPERPTLSELQRLRITNGRQRLEILQLRAAAIEREFAAAKAEWIETLKSVAMEGYELDVETLTYREASK